jgi:hypothetical protein
MNYLSAARRFCSDMFAYVRFLVEKESHFVAARQDGAAVGQNGTNSVCLPKIKGNQGKSSPRAGTFFETVGGYTDWCTKVTKVPEVTLSFLWSANAIRRHSRLPIAL